MYDISQVPRKTTSNTCPRTIETRPLAIVAPETAYRPPLLVRFHELISQNLSRELLLTQGRCMRPRFQTILAMDRRGEALAPVVSREMSRHILGGSRMDEIGVRAGIICDANPKSVNGIVWETP